MSEAPTQEEPGCQVKEELQVGDCYCLSVLNKSVMVARIGPTVCIFLKKKDKKKYPEINCKYLMIEHLITVRRGGRGKSRTILTYLWSLNVLKKTKKKKDLRGRMITQPLQSPVWHSSATSCMHTRTKAAHDSLILSEGNSWKILRCSFYNNNNNNNKIYLEKTWWNWSTLQRSVPSTNKTSP